jgi:type II secretory pathway pseudopilin PulG
MTGPRLRAGSDEGYVLFGVIIAVVILGIFMVAAVPLWQKVVQRERENELIFRGYQYMQAIERYQRKYPGAYPPTVEILVKQKFLRRAYSDPMSEDGKWNILRQLSPELQPGGGTQIPGGQSGITPLNESQARLTRPGSPAAGPPGATRQPAPTGGRFQSSLGRGASDQTMGGIVGVASRSTEKTFYQVPGKEKYKDWLFVWGLQPAGAASVPVPVSVPDPGLGPGPRPTQPGRPRAQAPGSQGQTRVPMGTQRPGQLQGQNPSPFPGLPPPPTLTRFGIGAIGAGPVPGQTTPGQPGLPPGSGEGSFEPEGQPPGPGGFGNPPGGMPTQMQPQPHRQPQPQPRPPGDE